MGNLSEIPTAAMFEEVTPQLRLEKVSLIAPLASNYLLEDISFQVSRGDRVAIFGASGAGKSTLLRLLNRLSEPTSGSIYLENQDYKEISAIALRQQVTLVLQESKLLGMSVREAIAYPLKLRGLSASEIMQQQSYAMEMLHIPKKWLDRTELQLSAGQKQLVAIARALVIKPKILLLDEPTSALDAGKAHQVLQVLAQLATNKITILMVNHQSELLEQFSTQVLHLQGGKIVQNAPASLIDWVNLRQSLIEAEIQESEEWS